MLVWKIQTYNKGQLSFKALWLFSVYERINSKGERAYYLSDICIRIILLWWSIARSGCCMVGEGSTYKEL